MTQERVNQFADATNDHQFIHVDRLITFDLLEKCPYPVYADRDRIQQVLNNYLTNALKFAPVTKPIRVGITLIGPKAKVWVQDQGPGLTPQEQERIWQQYYQVSHIPIQSGWKTGLGLGLYICQQLIHHHHGEIGVESIPGKGATFWFTLPIYSVSPNP